MGKCPKCNVKISSFKEDIAKPVIHCSNCGINYKWRCNIEYGKQVIIRYVWLIVVIGLGFLAMSLNLPRWSMPLIFIASYIPVIIYENKNSQYVIVDEKDIPKYSTFNKNIYSILFLIVIILIVISIALRYKMY